MTNRALNTVVTSHVISRFIVGDYCSRDPGCITTMLCKLDLPTLQDWCKQQRLFFFYKVVEGLVPAMPVEQFLKCLPASKRQIRPTKFRDFTAENIILIDRQATLNSRPFLVPHSNTEQHKNSFVRTTTDSNHLGDYQVKALALVDFKQRIVTQSTICKQRIVTQSAIWFACAHSPSVASIPIIRSSEVKHQVKLFKSYLDWAGKDGPGLGTRLTCVHYCGYVCGHKLLLLLCLLS